MFSNENYVILKIFQKLNRWRQKYKECLKFEKETYYQFNSLFLFFLVWAIKKIKMNLKCFQV